MKEAIEHLSISLLFFALACVTEPIQVAVKQEEVVTEGFDADNDGYAGDEDCDETSPSIHVGAAEICDEVDNNCDGNIDEGVQSTFYLDVDEDGFGSSAVTEEAVGPLMDMFQRAPIVMMTMWRFFRSANEVCDELDNDCNGEVDDGAWRTVVSRFGRGWIRL